MAKKHSKQITAQMTELKNYEKALSKQFIKEIGELAFKKNPCGSYNNDENALYCEIQFLLGIIK